MLLLFSNTSQQSNTRGQLRVRIGSDWLIKPVKVWDGSSWIQKNVRYWNGTTWVYTFDVVTNALLAENSSTLTTESSDTLVV